MILKNCLRIKYSILKGQAVLEYFILFAAIGVLGIVSLSTFFPKIRDVVQGTASQQGYFQKAANAIINADGNNPAQKP